MSNILRNIFGMVARLVSGRRDEVPQEGARRVPMAQSQVIPPKKETPHQEAQQPLPAQGVGSLLRISESNLQRTEDLAALRVPFVRCVNEELSLAMHMYVNVAIVQAVANSKVAILLMPPSAVQSDVEEIIELLHSQGWSLPSDGYQAWHATSQIIVSVSQGHLGERQIGVVRDIYADKKRTHLWQSFVNVVQWAYDHAVNDIDFVYREARDLSQVAFKIDGRYINPERWRITFECCIKSSRLGSEL